MASQEKKTGEEVPGSPPQNTQPQCHQPHKAAPLLPGAQGFPYTEGAFSCLPVPDSSPKLGKTTWPSSSRFWRAGETSAGIFTSLFRHGQ